MRTGSLDPGYRCLTGSERFQLFVAARARGDSAELERLFRTCRRVTVRQCDPAFVDRRERAIQLAVAVVAQLELFKGKLDVLGACEYAAKVLFGRAAEEAEFEALELVGDVPPAIRRAVLQQRGLLRNLHRDLRRELRKQAASVAHGFAAACKDELNVDAYQLLSATVPDDADLFRSFLGLAPDPELAEATKESLIELWRIWVGEPQRDEQDPQ